MGPFLKPSRKIPATHRRLTLLVTAKIRPANDPINSVLLYYRRMVYAEVTATMFDNGTSGDVTRGDGVWSALIPSSSFCRR